MIPVSHSYLLCLTRLICEEGCVEFAVCPDHTAVLTLATDDGSIAVNLSGDGTRGLCEQFAKVSESLGFGVSNKQ